MASQAFFYNAIFFTYALVLTDFYGIPGDQVGWFLLPFAAGNFLGPILLGRLFDSIGRRQMLAFTYGISGLLLASWGICSPSTPCPRSPKRCLDGHLLLRLGRCQRGLSHRERDVSTGDSCSRHRLFLRHRHRSSAEWRAPGCSGNLIDSGSRWSLFWGYLFGSTLMLIAAFIAARWAVAAERQPLEAVSRPLAACD